MAAFPCNRHKSWWFIKDTVRVLRDGGYNPAQNFVDVRTQPVVNILNKYFFFSYVNLLECHDPLYLCKSSCHLNAGWSQLFNFVTAKVQQLLWVLVPNTLSKNVIPLSGFCWKQQVWKHLHITLSTSYHCKCVLFSFKFILMPFSRDF